MSVHPGAGEPRTVAVVVTYNSEAVLGDLLSSLPEAFADHCYDLVVVDNCSVDGTLDAVVRADLGAKIVRLDRNLGYAAAINTVIREIGPEDALLVLNPDVRLAPGSARALLDGLESSGVGIAVPLLESEDGSVANSLRRRPSVLGVLGEAVLGGQRAGRLGIGELVVDPRAYARPSTVDWATGAVMAISGRCLEAVGPWDESFFLYSEETDFALRARDAGYATHFVPSARAVHTGGASMVSRTLYPLLTINRLRLFRRRNGPLASAAFGVGLLTNELLRARRPTHRAALRVLLSRRERRRCDSTFGGRPRASDFVCFSAQDWWYHNRAHSDFQLMRRVGRERKVLFVNSIGLRMPSKTGSTPPLRRIVRKARSVAKMVRRPDRLAPGFIVMTPLFLPLYDRRWARRLNAALVRRQVQVVAAVHGLARPSFVVTIPTAVDVIEGMDRQSLVFNRSDKHSAYVEADTELIGAMEERLLRSADHVLYVSRELMREDAPLVGARAVFLDHGVDVDHFRRRPAGELPPDIAAVPGPRIGFFGGLDDYVVDFDLLGQVASAFPDASVVLIGDAGSPLDRVLAHPNVHWLGYKPYEAIPAYGSGFDVAIMPWLDNEWIRFCNPIKLKEYLALGLPVVSIDYPEGHRYDGLVRWATSAEEFVDQIRRSLTDLGPSTPEGRRSAVEHASWDACVAQLLRLTESG